MDTIIRPSSDLRNKYPEISDYCNSTGNAVYITRNGRDDTVVMSVRTFEDMERKLILSKIEEGLRLFERGEYQSAEEAFADIRKELFS